MFHNPDPEVRSNVLEIQSLETQHDKSPEVSSVQRVTQNWEPEEQIQEKNDLSVNPAHMMISNCNLNSTTSDNLLEIP